MRKAARHLALGLLVMSVGVGPAAPPVSTEPFAHSVLREQSFKFESEIAALMQKRGEPGDLSPPLLELQIDVRVLNRWLMAKAAESLPETDLQVCCLLRAGSLSAAARLLTQQCLSSRDPMTPSQMTGLKAFHDLTYKLPDLKAVGTLDDFCHGLSVSLMAAAGPLPIEVKDIPMMRPEVAEHDVSAQARSEAPSLAELLQQAQRVSVSPALRRQLVALAVSAADPQPPDAAPMLIEALNQALDLVDGIQHNTALDSATRPRLEAQLAEGLALFADVRTRQAGKARLDSLGRYRDTLSRIRKLKLTPSVQEKLAGVFIWIQQNPDRGSRVFEAIEAYLRWCSRFDARQVPSNLPPHERKAVEDLSRQFTSQRGEFLDTSAQLAASGGLASGIEALGRRVDALHDLLSNIESLERLPRALQILAAYKPRPAGALERRAAQALTAWGASSTRDDANALINDIEKLANLAGEAAPIAGDVPGGAGKTWAGGKLEAFDSRRSLLITLLASEAAAGQPMDANKLADLQTASVLAKALRQASGIETALRQGEALSRWVDWQMDSEQLRNLLEPYRQATCDAVAGFVGGDSYPLGQWVAIHNRFVPIVSFISSAAAYSAACEQLPRGLVNELAKLATPMEGQPFGTQRRVSFTLALRSRALQLNDAKMAGALVDQLTSNLRRDLHLDE